MNFLERAARNLACAATPRAFALFAAVLMALLPASAMAGGGANVVLRFTQQEQFYLWVSLAMGFMALVYGLVLARGVLAVSPGSEKMQEVGQAIKDGALAYLRQQVRTMSIFVIALAVGLFFLYGKFGPTTAALMALCFVLGVGASYIAGFAGMLMAVHGNTRTAHAALTSYKRSLEVAFRSGAVAGMVTVGMGLIGATAILLFAGENATRLLIGFGFGGSLAALFMRVGGGIFTKAADVGADLVGKVEAGIPEDDPRNPATIADNVGDNVGDCAGMAADVFESYEVTLVAAIVLGAATAAIFDRETWTKLILFALMARGVGIIASIVGVASVRGTEDLNSDPLKPIRTGFYRSAAIAAVLTAGIAWYMMGGTGRKIETSQLTAVQSFQLEEAKDYRALQETLAQGAEAQRAAARAALDTIAADKDKQLSALTVEDFRDPAGEIVEALRPFPMALLSRVIRDDTSPIRAFEISAADIVISAQGQAKGLEREDEGTVSQLLIQPIEELDRVPNLAGYQRVRRADDPEIPALQFATTAAPPLPGQPPSARPFQSVGSKFFGTGKARYIVAELRIRADIPARPGEGGAPATPAQTIDRQIWVGPIREDNLESQIEQQQRFATEQQIEATYEILRRQEVALYANARGDLALGVEPAADGSTVARPHLLRSAEPLTFYPMTVAELERAMNAATPMMGTTVPPQETIDLAVAKHQVVPWWTFFAAILFGIVMAFAIEILTDYYVSSHKKPVKEVAGVSTAGPAPMIIQGFAYGLESSVFQVFAIVIALLFPLFLFDPNIYGGYILSFYGIALVGLGLLTTTGYILAMDTFGPISDNAQGIYEMSGEGRDNEDASRAVQRLDAAGNTTKALTKGFAIATAVVAAVALFHSYLEDSRLSAIGLRLDVPEIFLGLMIGGAAPYLFSAFSINAVGRSSFDLINEVRRQFREDPGIMKGESKPNYARCVAIVTAAAQKELLGPGILAIALPAAVGFGFSIGKAPVEINGALYNLTGAQALGGYLAGIIVSGQLMAVLLANSGGMWDNSKKLIEDGMYGGKGTDPHKAAVVCDTVGDPFKDTAGPALNPLIKVMNLVALLLATVVIQPFDNATLITITLVAVGALAIAIYMSKRGSMSESLSGAAAAAPAIGPGTETVPTPKKSTITVDELNKTDDPDQKA